MDSFVAKKLQEWGYEDYQDAFQENEIDEETFYKLGEDHLKDIIKSIRKREKFIAKLKSLKKERDISQMIWYEGFDLKIEEKLESVFEGYVTKSGLIKDAIFSSITDRMSTLVKETLTEDEKKLVSTNAVRFEKKVFTCFTECDFLLAQTVLKRNEWRNCTISILIHTWTASKLSIAFGVLTAAAFPSILSYLKETKPIRVASEYVWSQCNKGHEGSKDGKEL